MNKTTLETRYRIGILGCGWLGLPLSEFFIAQGLEVKGSTPSPDKLQALQEKGIKSFHINLDPSLNSDYNSDFFDTDVLIINFPPKRRDDILDWHTQQIESLVSAIRKSKIDKIIFISSTSVYAEVNGEVSELNEETPAKNSGKALRIAEELLLEEPSFRTTIIRFGGLIGYDRKPGRFFAGKKNLKNGDVPVNLIHRDDCIGIINHVITNNIWGETFNACCPEHPRRKDFYKAAAEAHHFEIPEFLSNKDEFKIVNCDKLIKSGYSFLYQNPVDCLIV
ncbi:SDR family oxidoreductase [Marinifilum caeruleilacunae]|uniref:SDR family oxidoreductase n=1 Tax=Marinifilum caeruleilacunae TaxID=2499076 RepID=A0ABX1WQT0_9BACT|nr:SDR family oxidoreductase [Marinifilum caeruleilacunae]NOU58401.1 SDR family oxidoreductase [Marinifilum caeruleilacunae]